MEKELPMKWYNACKVMSLIFGIFGVLGSLMMIGCFGMFAWARSMDMSMEVGLMVSSVQSLFGFGCFIYVIGTVMLFITYWALKNRRKAALYLMYAFNIGIPLLYLVSIPLQLSYADNMVLQLMMSGELDIYDAEMMERLMNFLVPSISIVYAIAFGGALIPNSIYFKKRKDLLD